MAPATARISTGLKLSAMSRAATPDTSINVIVETSEVDFTMSASSLPYPGRTFRSATGNMILRYSWALDIP